MTVGKPFSLDKPNQFKPAEMTKLQAFNDFFVFIALSAAYIVQVSLVWWLWRQSRGQRLDVQGRQ